MKGRNTFFYATDPKAIEWLLKLETFTDVWECACGQGHLSKVLMDAGIHKRSTDLIDRGFGESGIDFLGLEVQEWDGDIITYPPFKYAKEFVLKALQIIPTGNNVAIFLRMQFLESQDRKHFAMKRTGVDPKIAFGIYQMAKTYVSNEKEWREISPIDLIQRANSHYPALYLSCGLYDKYGNYEGTEALAQIAHSKGVKTNWHPLYGGHCAIDISSLADFLAID